MVSFDEYAAWVAGRWKIDPSVEKAIAGLGLAGEAGEVADAIKKDLREASKPSGAKPFDRQALKLELGDVIHYWFTVVRLYGFTPQEIIDGNVEKLLARDG